MKRCSSCNGRIFFKPVIENDLVFCHRNCAKAYAMRRANEPAPQHDYENEIRQLHESDCPKCTRPGPIDVYESHTVVSFLVFSRMETKQMVCCRKCGRDSQLFAILFSCLAGWWSVLGLIFTPMQISRNIAGMLKRRDEMSYEFRSFARRYINALHEQSDATPPPALGFEVVFPPKKKV